MLALVAFTGAAATGAVTCSYSSATVNPVRVEGKTEQVGDYIMLCSNTGTGPVSLSITATMSQPVTSKAIGTMGQSEAAVIVKDTLNVQPTTATPGTTSGMQASFTATVPPNSNSDSHYILYLTNIRIDATGLTTGSQATEQVQVYQGTNQLGNFTAQPVAVGVQGLGVQSISGTTTPPACFAYTGTAPLFTVNFGENANDPAAFKTQGGSGNSAIGSWQSNNTETGYYVSTGGYNNQANSGTRIRVLLTGIPANTNVYIPLALSSANAGSSNGYGTLTLTTTESGAYSAVSPATNPSGYQGPALGQLTVTNGAAEAVYEVTSQTLGAVENYAAPVYVVAAGTVPITGSIGVTVSLAPVGASSNVPNYAQTSSTTALSVPNCVTVTSTAAANAIQNFAYSQNLSATGGQIPYTWSLYSGNPPTGITVGASGSLSGTPTASPGSYPFTVQVQDANNATATQSLTITLNAAVSITTSTLANPAVGEVYSSTLSAAYGNGGPYTWALVNGSSLPGGLTLSSGGVIGGTPTTSGTSSFSVMATDTMSGASAVKMLSLIVNPALSITTTSFPVGVVGTNYPNTGAVAAGGTGGYSWSLTSGMSALNAAGLSFSAPGVLSGTPTSTGSIPITVKVTDQGGGAATQNVTVQINSALSVSTTSVPTGEVGVAVSYQLQYAGGSGTGSWLAAGGTLPNGVTISGSGVVTGTPTQSGNFTFTARFTDSYSDVANGSVTWTVNAAPTVTTTLLPAGQQNSSYSATLTAMGGSGAGYTWTVPAESLPAGLSLSAQGQITGTPTAAGNYSITVSVTDSLGGKGVQTLNFTIDVAGTIITTNIPSGDVIVNISGTTYGAQSSSGPNQIYWQLPFNANNGALLEYTVQPGAYTFRVIDPADAQAAFPSLTNTQLGYMYTAWTYNSPYTTSTLVFNSSAVGNSAQNQLFSVAEIDQTVYTAQAAYNRAIAGGFYNQLFVGARNATPTYNYTFTVPTTLVFAVPDNGLYDNGGGTSILIAPVAANPPSITTSSLPSALVNTSYGPFTLAATGGSGIYTWSVNLLPPGLSLSTTGTISGTPTSAANYSGIVVTVTDSVSGTTATQTYSMQINSNLSITTSSLTGGTVGQAFSQTLAATGGSGNSANYSWSATGLPSFLTLSASGVLSGTPTNTGTFNNIVVTVTDSVSSQTANMTYSLTVNYPAVSFNYLSTAIGLGPLGYFRLENTSGNSEVGGYTYASTGATVQGGAPIGVTPNNALSLNGTTGAITTSLSGGITNAATIVAWVNLNTLPSAASNSILYVAGESQVGNDLDLQFTGDNYLRFYTTNNGQSIGYLPNTSTLAGQWHMIAATFANAPGSGTGARAIYWDGVQVATDTTVSFAGKTAAFNIGATPVFSGRNFPGAIDEVGIWSAALSAQQIAELYAITSGSLPTGVSGSTYPPITLYAKGGSGKFTWSASGLPAGITLTAGGVLSGTPTTAGTSNPVITILDTGTSSSITPTAQIVINPQVSIQTTALSAAALETAYSSNITVSGGLAPYTFTVTAGALPAGLALNASTGAVSGTPTTAGSGNFTLQVTDFSGGTATQQITWSVSGLLTISTTSLPPAALTETYGQNLTAINATGSVNWTVISGSLPTGVTLSTAGVLAGTPTVSGSFTFGILASDSSPNTSTQTLTLTVNPALTISSMTPQAGAVGETYSAPLSASGGVGSYTWSVLNGNLPGGVSLSTAGVLSGTPTASGSFTITAKVADQNGGTTSGSVTVTINSALTITTTSLPAATAGASYSQTLMATGGVGSYTWSVNGLPNTIACTGAGLCSGTPTTGGSYPLTLKVTDGNSFSTTQMLTLTVSAGPLTITTTTLPGATNGTPYSTTLAASGGVSPYTWSLNSGTLAPAGLAISAGGVISGTPNTTGGLPFTVQLTDNANNSTTQSYSLPIAPATPPTYDFAVANEGGSIVRISDLSSRDATICAAGACGSYYITADAQGNIYSRNKTGILKIAPSGTVSTVLNFSTTNSVLSSSAGVGGIALDGLGNIIFVDNSADAVFRVKTDGTGFTQVAPFPTLSPNTAQDTYVAVDTNGNYIVADDGGSGISVWKFTPNGATGTSVLDGTIPGGVSGLAIDPSGNYDVLDYIGNRVLGVPPGGGYNTLYSTVANDCCQLLGLAIEHGTSNLIIASSGSSALARITPAGAATYIAANLVGRPSSVVSIPAPSAGPLTISPSSLPNGNTGQTYGPISLTASGGSGNYTWTGTGFPSGIGISSSGVINGSTSQAGPYSINVTATDTVTAQTGTASYSISFTTPIPALTITQTAGQLSTALGGSVSASFSASGGTPPYTFAASGLPGGVSISSSTGAISGTPTQAGTFSVGVQVSDQQPRTAGLSLTISVLGLTSGNLPAGVAGQSYSGSIGAVGGSGSYTFTATGLPTGLTLNSSTGAIVGIVKTAGTYKFSVTVTDSGGLTIGGSFSVTIAPPPALKITSSSLPGGNVGVPYGQGLTATGGFPPYTWAQSGGSLPAGMSFSSTGVVSGTPTAPGTYSFGAMATDTSGGVTTASVSLTIQPAPLTISTSPTLPSGIAGFDYPMQVFTATGGTGAYTWSLSSGSLPAGIAFSGGVLSGNTSAVGTYALGITVTDAASSKATASYSLTIRPSSAADLLISSGSIGFTVSAPSTAPPPAQNISVQSSQAGTLLSYSLAVSPAAPWLSIQNGASTPDNISASLTASALTMPAGTYNTTVTLTCTSTPCAGHAQTVGVALTVNSAPASLSVGTSLLSFGLSTASPVPSSQTISLANAGGGSLLFGSVSCEASWCTVSGVPGTLTGGQSGSITVTVDPNAAGPGFSRTQVDIVSSGGKASVPVNVLVATNPTMTLAPVGQQFGMPAGSGPGNPNGAFLVTVANGSSVNWSASVVSPNTPWLVLGSTSGTSTPSQPGTVSYSIGSAAATLAPGAYYGQIQITSSGVVDSPQVFEVVLNVLPATSASVPDAEPGGLLFITTAAATPPPQTVTVYTGSPSALTFQASVTPASVSSWLSVSAATGQTSQTAPGSVSVTVNPAKLSPGIYTAGVSFSLSAAAVRTVNVTVIVTPASASATAGPISSYGVAPKAATCTASALAPTQTGLVNNFSAPVAWPTPLSIVLADNCGSLLTNGQIVATFSNGDPPLALTLANPAAATYSATWTPRSAAAQMSITAHVTAPGYPAATAQIVGATAPNAAPVLTPHGTLHSFAPVVGAALAPGTIVQIYGQNLAAGTSQPTTIPLPTTSGGTQVIIGGLSAPLYYVSAGQINAQIPFELTPLQPYQVIVSANGALTTPDTVNLTPAVPGFAAFGDGTLIAQHGDGSLVSATSPARSGEYLVAYLAGMGATNATPASGAASPTSPLALPSVMPNLTINGQSSPIAFAGLTPGLVGLYQMNFQVPAGLPAGDITIVLSQAGVPTNQTVLPYMP